MEQPLIAVDDIPDEGAVTVDFFGREVLVYNVDGLPRATANVCTHLGGPLQRCDGGFVCTGHGATFDGASGASLGTGRAWFALEDAADACGRRRPHVCLARLRRPCPRCQEG